MTTQPRVLFVDDEPHVLDGLRRALKSRRKEWDMDFVATPAAALAAHREKPFDAVVTDIAMPGMGGLDLIQAMRKSAPGSIYIILTGTADLAVAVDAINKAKVFRFFTKPSSADLIAEGIAAGLEEQKGNRLERGAHVTANALPAAIGVAALNRVSVGVVVTNREGRVLFANQAGGALLSHRDGLWLGSDGVCRTMRTSETTHIQRLIAAICDSPPDGKSTSVIAVSRPSLKRSLTVLITPLYAASEAGCLAALFVADHENLRLPASETIGKLFGLTPSESRLACAMVQGPDLEDAARECGITVSTARTYLKQIFAKTGTARQSELLKLVLTTPTVA